MLKPALLVSVLLITATSAIAQGQSNGNAVPVEVVATASEYVPNTTTISHPGHAYTDCHGGTSYFGDFRGFEDSNGRIHGDVSGTANTDTRCQTTFTPPTETSLTHYDRVNYTIAQGSRATLYLLSCTQHWMLTKKERTFVIIGALTAGSEGVKKNAKGTWTECPAFTIGAKYALSVGSTSDAHLEGAPGGNTVKLDYLSSSALPPAPSAQSVLLPQQPQAASSPGVAKVHITSTPNGGEIYVDGKFFGNAPSDVTLSSGEHVVRVVLAGRDWTRTVQITSGEIQLHAEFQ
jgi:PEGA domain